MNDHKPTATPPELPQLPQESIERIEREVFDAIAADRASAGGAASPSGTTERRRSTRRRAWFTAIGVAAAFVAGVLIAPPLVNLTSTTDVASYTSESTGGASDTAVPEGVSSDAVSGGAAASSDREIIASAKAALRVDDIARAADSVSALAEDHGGYVEITDISASTAAQEAGARAERGEHGWISVRVPSADLAEVTRELGDVGTVVSSSMSQEDVTSTAIDLRARVEATQASVDRLTELMAQSGSVSDLIDAEVALTDRQAQLESYTQQLAALEDQVAMSSLQVQLTTAATAAADPDGFAAGLLAGWNGLVVSLNALVITLGFLLPWLLPAGAVVLAIWLIRRRRRRATASENR